MNHSPVAPPSETDEKPASPQVNEALKISLNAQPAAVVQPLATTKENSASPLTGVDLKTPNRPEAQPTIATKEKSVSPPVTHRWNIPAFLHQRSVWLTGSILLVVGAGAVLYFWVFATPAVRYATASVERGDVESSVVAAGIIQPSKYVDVGAQTSGMLESLKVERGDAVLKDQLLAEIDPVLAKTALKAAKAVLENITAQFALKQAQLVLAKLQKVRNDDLFASTLISASDRDITRANYDVAFADAASFAAQMKAAGEEVNTATANVGYTQITAPISGEVVSISTLEGQTLNANQQAPNILRIADIDTVTVWAQVSEADIVRVVAGQAVYFTILGDSARWNGKIRQILPTPELINNVVFYDVLFDIPNRNRELKIQMTAQVFIVLAQAKGVLTIPTSVIGNAGEGATLNIQVLKANGTAESRTIKLGIKSELIAEVKSGLTEKEQVVVREITAKGKSGNALTTRK